MANLSNNKQPGAALILTVGILAMLMLMGLSFAVHMRLEQDTAATYMDGAKAKYLAEAGINNAISLLKADAEINLDYSDTNISINGNEQFLDDVSSYTVVIEDEQRKINIDDTNSNLGQILKNLRDIIGSTLTDANCDDIVTNAPYQTKEEIKSKVPGIGETKYNDIKDYITIYSYQDPNTDIEPRRPINVNTASLEVLKAVLIGLDDGAGNMIPNPESDTAFTKRLFNEHLKSIVKSWASKGADVTRQTLISDAETLMDGISTN